MTTNINNAIFLDANLRSDSQNLKRLCKTIEKLATNADIITNWTQKRRRHLELFVLNMLVQAEQDPKRYVIYQRNKNFYKLKRYFNMSYDPAKDIADLLQTSELELADGITFESSAKQEAAIRKAQEDEPTKKTDKRIYSSRIRASSKLTEYADQYGLSLEDLNPYQKQGREVLIMKDVKKKLCNYEDTDASIQMRENINRINKYVSGYFIGHCMYDDYHDKMNKGLLSRARRAKIKLNDEIPEVLDYTRTSLYRVFNNGSFEQGGRFYGGWWQSVPSEYRPYIRIDDEITIEPDFTGIHIQLIYSMLEEQVPGAGDPYLPNGFSKQSRGFMKALFNILLNAPTRKSGIDALRGEYPEPKMPNELKHISYDEILEIFLCHHPLLTPFLGTGEGIHLQFIDAEIAEHVMLNLMDQDIPALPIHDSFVVKLKDRDKLIQAMDDAVYELHRIRLGIKFAETEADWVYAEGLAEDVGGNPEKYVERSPSLNRSEFTKYFREYDRWHN